MEFIDTIVVASVKKLGLAQLELVAGKSLRIETTPQGVEILNAEVPAGKTWTVEMSVLITETDA